MNDREEWRERVSHIRATSATWWLYIYIYIYIYTHTLFHITFLLHMDMPPYIYIYILRNINFPLESKIKLKELFKSSTHSPCHMHIYIGIQPKDLHTRVYKLLFTHMYICLYVHSLHAYECFYVFRKCKHIYVCVWICVQFWFRFSLSLSLYIYIYIHTHVCVWSKEGKK